MKALQILFLFCTAVLYGQYAGWSSFYSFDQITAVHYGDNGQIYGVAQNSLFSYDPTANEVVPITTVNGLLGDEIDALQVTDDFMIVGYSNGILGIHTLMDGSVILDNSIQRNLSIEAKDKTIHSFLVDDQTLYLSAGYGISMYDLSTNRFIDSYFLGPITAQFKSIKRHWQESFCMPPRRRGYTKQTQVTRISFWKALGIRLLMDSGNPSAWSTTSFWVWFSPDHK